MSTLKSKFLVLFVASCVGLSVIGCSRDDSSTSSTITEARITRIDTDYKDIIDNTSFAGIQAQIIYPISTLVGMRFVYPYKDPMGNPTMLSGMICIPKTLYDSEDKKAQGIMLYNHHTIMTDYECPSYGNVGDKGALGLKEISALGLKVTISSLIIDNIAIGRENHKMITVAADYYGFGETGSKLQYYCEGNYNARASLEALKAAKKLLSERGYTWGDYLLNVGYSQGGQTAIAVQKFVDSGEYSEKISATFAGSGPYDLTATYKSYLDVQAEERDVSVVVYPVLSFNEYKVLGINYGLAFRPALTEKINEWFFSKNYTREEIDRKIKDAGMKSLSKAFSDALLNVDSDMSKKLVAQLDTVTLTKGWTPKSDDRLYLFYSKKDTFVPPVNCEDMVEFFRSKNFTITEKPNVDLTTLVLTTIAEGTAIFDNRPKAGEVVVRISNDMTHEDGGSIWMLDVISEMKAQFPKN